MKKSVIIFDLDGTLLNTLEDLTDSTNYALRNFGYCERTIDEVRNFVGNGVSKLIERAIPMGLENPNFIECLELFKNNYSKNKYNKTAPYDGILDLLRVLKLKNIKIAVVSNKFDKAVKELCQKYFPDLIDIAVGENEAEGIKKKPYPDTVNKVLELFSADKSEAIYVGDSEVDIYTAQNANMPCLSVTWGFKTREFLLNHGANNLIDNPEQIIEYIEQK